MTLADLVQAYAATRRPGWVVLEDEELISLAVAATRYYLGYGDLGSLPPGTIPALADIDDGTEVSVSEWATISPLFALYVEKENALRLEASRSMGLEAYGRQSSEVQGDITMMENETLPMRAFSCDPFEVS